MFSGKGPGLLHKGGLDITHAALERTEQYSSINLTDLRPGASKTLPN